MFERLWSDDRVARTLGGSRDRAQVEVALAEAAVHWAQFPEFWGAGYASEAAAGALKHGQDVAGLHEVVAYALATNEASISVMRRLDFAFERNLHLPVGPHVLYRRVLSG